MAIANIFGKLGKIGALIGLLLAIWSCSKDTPMPSRTIPVRGGEGSGNEERLKQLLYENMYYDYLWQDQLPSTFAVEQYPNADAVLERLMSYATDLNGERYDRFSFLDRSGVINRELQEGILGSFGFDVRYNNDTDLYVKSVYRGSPADRAGIDRGWRILAINGNRNLDHATQEIDNYRGLYEALDAQNIDLVLQTPNEEEVFISLTRGNFTLHPIIVDSVYTVGAKRVGYFVFDSFISTLTEQNTPSYVNTEISNLLSRFEQQDISELIIDLRYNGGGALVTVESLANLMVPQSGDGRQMFSFVVNDSLKRDDANREEKWWEPVNFNKTNNLNLQRIYFLVTEGTASASELLINSLKPYVEVKVIGEDRTYGKPVGFSAVNLLGNDLYAVSFQTFNAEGYGDYFQGIPADYVSYDELSIPFGDQRDPLLLQGLHYAEYGTFNSAPLSRLLSNERRSPTTLRRKGLNHKLDQRGLKDLFHFRN